MALELNVNSYADTVGAGLYFADSLRSADWSGIAAATKPRALIEATRYLQRLRWGGTKTVDTQPLHFPINGETEVPVQIIEATYELAIRLALDPTLIDSIGNQSEDKIKRVKADTVEVEFFVNTSGAGASSSGQLFSWIQALVKDYLDSAGYSPVGCGKATGTSVQDQFADVFENSGAIS